VEHARRAVRLGEQVHAGSDLADMYRNLAESSLAAGEIAGALAAGGEALAIARVKGRVYLGAVAVTLARVCAGAVLASTPGAELHLQAMKVARALGASLATDFDDPDLRPRAEECRALLGRAIA